MVEGLDKLEARWSRVPELVRAAAASALEASAEDIVQVMRRFAPVDSGDLRDSIGWTWGEAPKGAMVLGKVGGDAYGTLRITIYAGSGKAFYARFVEFGTQSHALALNASVQRGLRQTQGGQHGGAAAQPFFYPAYRLRKRAARTRVTRAINKALASLGSD